MVARYYIFQITKNETRWVDSPSFLLRCEDNPEGGFKSDAEAYNFMRSLLEKEEYSNSDLTIVKTYEQYKDRVIPNVAKEDREVLNEGIDSKPKRGLLSRIIDAFEYRVDKEYESSHGHNFNKKWFKA